MNICKKCGEERSLEQFSDRHTDCNVCRNVANQERLRDPDRKKQKDKSSRRHYLKKYGLSEQDFDYLYFRQKGACLICKESFVKTPFVDHHHISDEVRGLLCRHCNSLLGYAKENPVTLQRAIDYLSGILDIPSEVSREDFDRYFENRRVKK